MSLFSEILSLVQTSLQYGFKEKFLYAQQPYSTEVWLYLYHAKVKKLIKRALIKQIHIRSLNGKTMENLLENKITNLNKNGMNL